MLILMMNFQLLLMRNIVKGSEMKNNKVFIVCLVANAITACSSPPQLTEPDGDWISFDMPQPQQVSSQPENIRNPFAQVTTDPKNSLVRDNDVIRSLSNSTPPVLPLLINADGKNVPLHKAVRTIVPQSFTIKLAPDVSQNFRSTVSWSGGDQWPHVLRKMLEVNGLKAEVNSTRKEVIVQFAQKVSVPATALPVKPAKPTGKVPAEKVSTATVLKTPLVPKATEGVKPVTMEKSAQLLNPVPVKKPLPSVKAAPALRKWALDKGTTLKTGYLVWASEENCPVGKAKWSVRWETDTDYPIDYPLSFSASSFEDATSQLFSLYRKAQAPLYVSGYRNQCLIIISDRK